MKTVSVQYRVEPEGAWAESDDIPGFVAAGETLEEVRQLVFDGVPFYCDEDVEIREEFGDSGQPVYVARVTSGALVYGVQSATQTSQNLSSSSIALARPSVELHPNTRPVARHASSHQAIS